jgi:hypothetical protein
LNLIDLSEAGLRRFRLTSFWRSSFSQGQAMLVSSSQPLSHSAQEESRIAPSALQTARNPLSFAVFPCVHGQTGAIQDAATGEDLRRVRCSFSKNPRDWSIGISHPWHARV